MKESWSHDSEGLKYKHPERSCDKCNRYPCFRGIAFLSCNFAKYGCRDWENN